ncbi:MAG: hypothetical protein AMJ61_10900 [Desulfobacterales bacterium SG8_35_2]|jgi:hypothetical protein|nr:MAG: hypothetical protein AMJ61_10900 [Desulfobacterales bacterium SG8_35_2]
MIHKYKSVGIVGMPPLAIIQELNRQNVTIHDLDTPMIKADMELTAPYLPRVYCAILRTVVLNALHLSLDAIYIDVGPGKCDCALHVATVLEDMFAIPIFKTHNEDMAGFGTPVSQSGISLLQKFERITEGVKTAVKPPKSPAACTPTAGFWGVPPRDFSILDLFPDTTHIYGWTRCMENKTPADHELELVYNPDIPTVFYAQSFCAKTALARHLALKHPHGLYLDSDVTAGGSAKAKIQAFLELSMVY